MQKPLTTPEFKKRCASLLAYMKQRLAIKETPALEFKDNAENAGKDFGYTGNYSPDEKKIRIYVTGRHQNDILRTFAHEVIHHWQNERGVLIHSEAAATADPNGNTAYAQTDEHLRKCEFEAYLFGNMMFRDWQDQNRHGVPQKVPTLPPTFV
jgi:hypothetical protein